VQVTAAQWVLEYYPQGKTSTESKYNIPGRVGWVIGEITAPLTLLYIYFTLPKELGSDAWELPWGNWTMAGCYVSAGEGSPEDGSDQVQLIHYAYRAVIAPVFLNPSMSPMSPVVCLAIAVFQLINATVIGGWLAGYGPTTVHDWAGRPGWCFLGLVIWCWGLLGNYFHDDDLREIRRAADRKQRREAAEQGKPIEGVDKVYMVPKNGLFKYVLHAHYLCEWIEWAGWWMVGGWNCHPARIFLVNEVTTMLPRALQGKRWYEKKFGKEKVGNRKAVIPGLV
jgi:3-oxo-5-alpha-steroid 4-dehydrogenase 1